MSALADLTVEESWRRIAERDGDIQAFRETYRDRAMATATGALAGVPIAIKDNIVTVTGNGPRTNLESCRGCAPGGRCIKTTRSFTKWGRWTPNTPTTRREAWLS